MQGKGWSSKILESRPSRGRRAACHLAFAIPLMLGSLAGAPGPAMGQGVAEAGEPDEVPKFESFKLRPLPVSAKAARAWIALHETMIKPLPDGATFGEVLQAIKAAVRGKDGKEPAFEFYFNPIYLHTGEITMATPVPAPFVGQDEVPLVTYLTLVLEPHTLTLHVHDGTVIIEGMVDDGADHAHVTAPEAWTWLLLHETVPLSFPDGVSLKDLLQAVYRGTAGKGKGGRGLLIRVAPFALQNVEKNMDSKVTIDLERAPLCTALGLALKQLDLKFSVTSDGVMVIGHSDEEDAADLMDEAEIAEEYQNLRYDTHAEKNMRFEETIRRKTLGFPANARAPQPAANPNPGNIGSGMR